MERNKASRVLAVGRGGCIPPHTLSGLGLGGSERVSSETLAPGGPEGRWGRVVVVGWRTLRPPRVVLFLALCFLLEICEPGQRSTTTSDLRTGGCYVYYIHDYIHNILGVLTLSAGKLPPLKPHGVARFVGVSSSSVSRDVGGRQRTPQRYPCWAADRDVRGALSSCEQECLLRHLSISE